MFAGLGVVNGVAVDALVRRQNSLFACAKTRKKFVKRTQYGDRLAIHFALNFTFLVTNHPRIQMQKTFSAADGLF